MTPVIGWPSGVTKHSCALMENIFINLKNEGTCCMLDNDISDHRSVHFELDIIGEQNLACNMVTE